MHHYLASLLISLSKNPYKPSSFPPKTNTNPTQQRRVWLLKNKNQNTMNVLVDSNLEILAFNYVSFGFFTIVNNLWPWVAVITAAVSFWRMKTSASVTSSCSNVVSGSLPSKSNQSLNDSTRFSEISQTSSVDEPAGSISPASALHLASAVGLISHVENDIAVTKGDKFITTYYVNELEVDGELTLEKENNGEEFEDCGEWWESWDKGLRMRIGDMSWYRYQDLTKLNGNVVRLWDDCRARKTNGIETCVVC